MKITLPVKDLTPGDLALFGYGACVAAVDPERVEGNAHPVGGELGVKMHIFLLAPVHLCRGGSPVAFGIA
ncbi:MAG: hypothetical protein ACD_75C02283G0001 [uncultured bacterium]|nr:MAG: hypothetical protein ACD_75C02283G0001 [uncultured bacterium]